MYEAEVNTSFGYDYGQYIRGYFLAPRTGAYKFYISGDDRMEVIIIDYEYK